ncbi:MAG: autotransporter outer membrane beta-barrel domain-containing protein [Alphaproteobacteria bacterium]|nr:MAG: autotransporter outer membrane beta-barrel domain-containing protein [Alphaproteobacteria bacterium]
MPFNSRPRALSCFGFATICTLGFNPAIATDVEISNDRTTAVDTTTLLGSSGTLTVTANGSITVGSGTALTLNGNHSVVMNGSVTSNGTSNAIAMAVNTGNDLSLTGTIDIDGAFEIPGPDSGTAGTGNYGFRMFGTGSFTGDISFGENSAVTVVGEGARGIYIGSELIGDFEMLGSVAMEGVGAIGIEIDAPVTGDITLDGNILSNNEGGIGVKISGPVDGTYLQAGNVSVGVARTTDDDGNVVAAIPGTAGVYIANDITGGFIVSGEGEDYVDDEDDDTTVPVGSITSYGGAPAVLIANEKTDGTDLVLGAADDYGYGFVNRGSVATYGQSSGIDSTTIAVLGGDNGELSNLAGGIHNDNGAIYAGALDATATAFRIGEGADVAELFNRGTVQSVVSVTSTTDTDGNVTYSDGGDATVVRIEAGGSMTSIVNEGTLYASAAGAGNTAAVVIDESGTLTSVHNSGIWYAALGTNNTDGAAIALDATVNTTGVQVVNEGNLYGDLLLGSGNDSVSLTGGLMEGDIYFGAGDNQFLLQGDATFTGSISHSGTLDFTVGGEGVFTIGNTGSVSVTNAYLTDDSTLRIGVDTINQTAGSLTATDTLFIAEDAKITPVFSTIVTESQTYEILSASSLQLEGGSLDQTLSNKSYLMHVTLQSDLASDTVSLTVRPKTATEIGFAGNRATLYDNLLAALDPADTLGTALTTVSSEDGAFNAMDALLPDVSNSAFQLAYTGTRQLQASLQDRVTDVTARRRLAGGFWAREMLGTGKFNAVTDYDELDYTGAGVLIGYDGAVSDHILWGVATGFTLQGAEHKGRRGDDLSIFSPFLSTYAIFANGGLFASSSASFWYSNMDRARLVEIGAFSKAIESGASGWTLAGDFDLGYDLKVGNLHLKPQVGVAYIKGHEGGYLETGGDGANLEVAGKSYNRLDGTARASLGYDINWKRKFGEEGAIVIRPEIYAAYRKKLSGNDAALTSVRFESGTDWFDLETNAISDKGYEGGAALNIFHAYGTASIRYTYEKQGDWRNHYAGFNFQLEF